MNYKKTANKDLIRLTEKEFINSKNKTPITIILDDIRSLNNIGSVFRTADAFIIEKIILCGITAKPPHKDIFKTALGATETVDWEYKKNILESLEILKRKDYKLIAIEQTENSTMLNDFKNKKNKKNKKLAIIFGNEIDGVSQKAVNLCDEVIEIPQFGTKHSLNISVSVGIVVWDLWNKLN